MGDNCADEQIDSKFPPPKCFHLTTFSNKGENRFQKSSKGWAEMDKGTKSIIGGRLLIVHFANVPQ